MHNLRMHTDDVMGWIRERMETWFVEILASIQRLTLAPTPVGWFDTPPNSPSSPPLVDHSSPLVVDAPSPLVDPLDPLVDALIPPANPNPSTNLTPVPPSDHLTRS